MWIVFALGSAPLSGLTAVLAKMGVRRTDPTVATALRTAVALAFAWLAAWLAGSAGLLALIEPAVWAPLVLSGLATGASWLCYWRALQEGPVSVVAPVDRLSVLVTAALSCALLGERVSRRDALGLALSVAGTVLMALPAT